jgi:ankyrin repeat protein
MQMHMWLVRMIAASVPVLVVSGYARSDPSNPLIGKWELADQSGNDFGCISLVKVEFTEKTVTTGLGPTKGTYTVTYGRDGDSYLASAGNGQAFRVKIESGGIEANGCHLVPAGGAELRAASGEGHLDIVRALLAEGADVNAKTNDGTTALLLASRNGHLDVVQVVLAKGAEVNAKDNKGVTALMGASVAGHLEIVQALLAKGANVNAKTNDGTTALLVASIEGRLEAVQTLLDKGADVNGKNNIGMTALMAASFKGHLDVVQALLAKGAEVNAKTNDGGTALMLASHEGNLDLVRALLAKGADVNAKANDGTTALGAATQAGHADVRALLVQTVAKPAAPLPGTAPAQGPGVAPSVPAAPFSGKESEPPPKSSAGATSQPFIGKWRPPSSFNCDYRVANIELTETTMTVAVRVGFSGALDSHTSAITYSRDGEFYVATPTAGNGPALRFKFNRPNIVLDSGCVLAPAN